jgi:hypothetical protein
LNTKSDYSSDIKVALGERDIPKLSYFDPSCAHDTNFKGKNENLVCHIGTTMMSNISDTSQVITDFFYSKGLPAKIDYEELLTYFAFLPHDVIQNTLRQATQYAKSIIHDPIRRHVKC